MSDKPTYTTAIIAAVPADGDPVNDVVIEDAHVTLQFLGEAANLSSEQVEEIQASLELMASNLYPFPADVAGTAELGPDKAKVLLVQSEPLTRLRELLGTVPAVSTAVAAVEQFPNWIPHLTLAYGNDGAQASGDGIESVQIGSLELWLAEEHHVYPMAKAAPGGAEEDIEEDIVTAGVIAAGLKEFDTSLHPRGRDGRFIEKFGVIKYLTGQGWAYGKVDGIYADETTGAVKITVTPSDLSGKPTGAESQVMDPKQLYRAPKTKAHLKINAPGAHKIGGQGGSNPGGLYSIPPSVPGAQTEKFYVKKPKTLSHGRNEELANLLYEEAGVPVPEVDLAADGQLYSKIVEGQQDMADQLNNPEWTEQIQRNFAVDAWLGNRDVFGMTYDNVLTDAEGVPWRIDNGGALLYRAMGEKKTDFGGEVTELQAFRQGKKAKIYGPSMSKASELDGAERVVAISPSRIDEMVAESGLPKSLADTLKARRLFIANYYGLELPESKQPDGAQDNTSAPLIDPPDIAASKGKARTWFKVKASQLAFLLKGGDSVEFPDSKIRKFGQDDDGNPLSIVGQQSQLLAWQQEHGADADVMIKQTVSPGAARPDHGEKISSADLTNYRWMRGDEILDEAGAPFKVLGFNNQTGAMLVQYADKPPLLLDTKGKDSGEIWTAQRWDPPATGTLDDTKDDAAPQTLADVLAQATEQPQQVQTLNTPTTEPETEQWQSGLVQDLVQHDVEGDLPTTKPNIAAPAPGKTGQAAEAETKIKADLDQPLPTGDATIPEKKTAAKGGAKKMVIGDNTEASAGDEVVSKKDGKTYVFVKPKGQYAVVTDPNGEDPNKQLLKLASTMTQPGKAPAADVAVEAPKTATGEVPALGMQAVSKDGHAGEITLISPDGKFVFITDANGVRKRKSTGTVTITGGAQPVDTAPKALPGPYKDYGAKPTENWTGEEKATGYVAADAMTGAAMVHVGYADGTHGLEPYTGQPIDSLATNTQGKIATFGLANGYLGPISATQLAVAGQALNKAAIFQVVHHGNVFFTDGTTGPHGGLVLWYASDNDADAPSDEAWELPQTPQVLHIISTEAGLSGGSLTLPEGGAFQTADEYGASFPASAVLYGDEAKTLSEWKGVIGEGSEISLDGQNWLKVHEVKPSGSVIVSGTDALAPKFFLNPWSSATYVVKAPPLVNGDEPSEKWNESPAGNADEPTGLGALDALNEAVDSSPTISELVKGDVVFVHDTESGNEVGLEIISGVEPDLGAGGMAHVATFGGSGPEPAPEDLKVKKIGNIYAGPVQVPLGKVTGQLYPGVKLSGIAAGEDWQVLTFPSFQDNGNHRFAVMINGDPEHVQLVEIGDGAGAQIGPDYVAGVHFANSATATEAGVDITKVNALFDAAAIESTAPAVDHNWAMASQGIEFGKAQYPIWFSDKDSSYYRMGPSGYEGWEDGQWIPVATGNPISDGLEKVWDGVPFEGTLTMPEDLPELLEGQNEYIPKPGESIAWQKLETGKGVLMVSKSGTWNPDDDVHTVMGPDKLSTGTYKAAEVTGKLSFQVIHDPFAEAAAGPDITHHEGPSAPSTMAQKLNQHGYIPQPGETILGIQKSTGAITVMSKNPDGTYQVISANGLSSKPGGSVKTKKWDLEDIKSSQEVEGDATFFTWTNTQGAGPDQTPVPGMPEGSAPYVPNQGESVLKVTWPSGNAKAYVQKQPGGGWYLLGPDGTVDESSDAIKSDHVVQLKLSGKGSQALKYEILHPNPQASEGDTPPVLTNKSGGDWTPEPGQKVVSLKGWDGDTDPWFFVQDEPGGPWNPAPNSSLAGGPTSDASMQVYLTHSPQKYQLVYGGNGAVDTGENAPAATAMEFDGYTPQPGEQVAALGTAPPIHYLQTTPGGKWFKIQNGEPVGNGISNNTMQMELESQFDASLVWPAGGETATPTLSPALAQDFGGYTPDEGEKVLQVGADDSPSKHFYVQQAAGEPWKLIVGGQPSLSSPMPDATVQQSLDADTGAVNLVFGGEGGGGPQPGGAFAGYQSAADENVIELTTQTGNPVIAVKGDDGNWWPILNGTPDPEGAYSQSTIEWANNQDGMTVNVLQGTMKGSPADVQPVDETPSPYAGVKADTPLTPGLYHFGAYQLDSVQADSVNALGTIPQGASVYAIQNGTGDVGTVWLRTSNQDWHKVNPDGMNPSPTFLSDTKFEKWVADYSHTFHKLQFGAPTQAPAANSLAASQISISGWGKFPEAGVPGPETFGHVATADDAAGTPAGSWMFLPNPVSPTDSGLIVKLKENYQGPAFGNAKIAEWLMVKNGQIGEHKFPTLGQESISMSLEIFNGGFYVQGKSGTAGPVGVPAAPAVAPAPATPEPAGPQYPGALAPSQGDIAAWGGSLTKDGHIPSSGMYVTGKGPMSGKIISVSKDKSKAVVLTSDGKKTTRLIEALKTDKTANYQAYAAPVTAKDIPQGMPLAVDTVAEVLEKTVKDGKFRAILTGHPGVSHGAVTVTKATGPSGKAYNRVHLTLTPAQREAIQAMLSGAGEKGDWATSSKQSDKVVIGDLLPMRKSSQDNPDGTPRWKVDATIKPPTHEVIGVVDDPGGTGIKIVTMRDRNTNEEITSRFHPGKALTVYAWDPNKPKAMTAGAFALNDIAKADGWTFTTDGGMSAATGGAQDAQLHIEPGQAVPTSKSALGQLSHSWQTLRNVSANGVVIETVDLKGSPNRSSTGTTIITIPEGLDETALGAAFAKLGIDYSPMTQDSAKSHVRGLLRTLLHLDTSDVDTPKHFTDEMLFKQAGQTMGIPDLGWTDVLVGVDESTGKTSYFWSDRARNALAAKSKYNLVYRAATTANAAQIVSTVKYGSASSMLKKTAGMLDGSKNVGNGASADTDNGNHAGHGSYASASTVMKLPSSNAMAGYKTAGMMIYHRPEAVLGRIMDFRVAGSDAFGKGQGNGADHLKHATNMASVKDYFLGGGLPTEAVGFIAVQDAGERTKAIAQLKADGFDMINGRPVEDIIITKQKAATMKPDDLPPVTIPVNARPILDLPNSYDAGDAAAAAPAVTAAVDSAEDENTPQAQIEEVA